jgi:membrane protein YdbS with pleckstrin-like domain
MNSVTLPKKTLLLWQIRVVMLTCVLLGSCLYFKDIIPFLSLVVVIVAALGIVITFIYLPIFLKKFEILFKNEAIVINYGVFIKFSHIMPYPRLIYAQTFATPLASFFGVTALSLKAARSRIIIPEIPKDLAQRFMDSLSGEVLYEKVLPTPLRH